MAYKSKIERFDILRGDVVSLPKEDVARLYACGVEICGPILWTFFGYILGGELPHMNDKRDDAILQGLIEHQRHNAERHYEKMLSAQKGGCASAHARWHNDSQARLTAVNQSQPESTTVDKEEEGKRRISRSVSDKAYTSLRDDAPTASCASLGGLRPSSVQDNKPQSANRKPIPCVSGWKDDKAVIERWIHEEDIRPDPIGYLYKWLGKDESEPERFRGALRKYRDDLGEDIFFDVVWCFIKDYCDTIGIYHFTKATETDKATVQQCKDRCTQATAERGKHLFARLNARKKDLGLD